MRHDRSALRGLAGATLLAATFATASVHAQASAEDLKEACAASYEQAQTLRRAAKLTLARAQLGVCQQTCPGSLAKDCRRWSEEIEREMPSVVLVFVDRNGRALSDAELSVDGEIRELPSNGAALPLDPGNHRLVVRVGEERQTASVVLQPRERRELRMAFSSVEAGPADAGAPGTGDPGADERDRDRALEIPPAAWAFGAIGVVGLGIGAVLGIKGHVDRGDLRSRCAPNCEQDEVDAIQRDWTIATIAAGVGAIATGVAVWIVVDADRAESVGIRSTPGGAVAAFEGRF